MIIVNQDRDEIVNFENINNIFIFYDNEVRACGNVDGNIYSLGKYETKERAKERKKPRKALVCISVGKE